MNGGFNVLPEALHAGELIRDIGVRLVTARGGVQQAQRPPPGLVDPAVAHMVGHLLAAGFGLGRGEIAARQNNNEIALY